MAGRPTVLTLDVMQTLEEHIREGAFEWVAAEAAGISRRTFYYWMKRGERGEEPYAYVETRVRQAQAHARLEAEKRVRHDSPLSWLRLGPGRERAGKPGWTLPVQGRFEESPDVQGGDEDVAMLAELVEALREAEGEDRGEAATR
jgi:hypothetical protein